MARFKKYKSKITPRRVARVIEANRALRTQVNAQAKGAEQSALIKLGQRLTSQSFGDGPVADDLRHAETLDQLREKFRACWVRGSGWRLEVGELLYKIKQKCEHGEWGGFLAEYDLARSTADDYIRHYKDTAQITETRQFEEPNPTPAPDPQAEGRKKEIEEEQKKRKGKKRTHHATEIRAKIKNLRPDQTACYCSKSQRSRRSKHL